MLVIPWKCLMSVSCGWMERHAQITQITNIRSIEEERGGSPPFVFLSIPFFSDFREIRDRSQRMA